MQRDEPTAYRGAPSPGSPLAWLEGHADLERAKARRDRPTLERMRVLMALLGDPQTAYPVVHITGTNGKTSTARMIAALLEASGLGVGLYTSPDLESVRERLVRSSESISAEELDQIVLSLQRCAEAMDEPPSRFELLTAAAFVWFADVAVDVAVVEVGLGGRFDATNVADGSVAVVTNISLDHTDLLGPTVEHIAGEKAGIVKPRSTLVLGSVPHSLDRIFDQAGADRIWRRPTDFELEQSRVAVGGRSLSVRTPGSRYEDLFLPLHGAHQGDNAAVALAAAEAFFDRPLGSDVVQQAFGMTTSPGRMEVIRRRPLVVLDGAHNVAGAAAAGRTVEDEFAGRPLLLVMGVLDGHDPGEMMDAFGVGSVRAVFACSPPSPRALPSSAVVEAARRRHLDAFDLPGVPDALQLALSEAGDADMVLVMGSLYLVGAARGLLSGPAGHPSAVAEPGS